MSLKKVFIISLLFLLGFGLLLQKWQNDKVMPTLKLPSEFSMAAIQSMLADNMTQLQNYSEIANLWEWAPLDGQDSISAQLLSVLRGDRKNSVEKVTTKKVEASWLFVDHEKYYIVLPSTDNWAAYHPANTTWSRIRIQSAVEAGDTSVELDLHDWTYAHTELSSGPDNHHSIKQVEWGIAADCRGVKHTSGMSVNLVGTPFAYSLESNVAEGSGAHGTISCSSNDQVCTGSCGGNCGYCGFGHPGQTAFGTLNVIDQVSFDAAFEQVSSSLEADSSTKAGWWDWLFGRSEKLKRLKKTKANATKKQKRKRAEDSRFASIGTLSKHIFGDDMASAKMVKFQFVDRGKFDLNYYLGVRHDFIVKPSDCWLWGVPNSIGSVFELQALADGSNLVTLRSVTVGRYVRAISPRGEHPLQPWVLMPDAQDTKKKSTHFGIEFEGDVMYLFSVSVGGYVNIPLPATSGTDKGAWTVRCHGPEGQNMPAHKNSGAKLKLVILQEKENKAVQDLVVVSKDVMQKQAESKSKSIPGVSGGTIIAIGTATTSKFTAMHSIAASPFFSILLPSFLETWEGPEASNPFQYRWYVGFDKGDPMYDTENGKREFHNIFNQTVKTSKVTLKLMAFNDTQGAPSWAVSGVMQQAYKDGADWLFQLNDDSRLISKGWERELSGALASNPTAKFVGATGPTDIKSSIFTHVFVHRTHMDIHGRFFPKAFKNYYSDDWITTVYGKSSTFWVPTVRLKHEIHAQKTGGGIERYKVDYGGWRWLSKEVEHGFMQVAKYLKNRSITPRMEPVCGFPAYLEKFVADGVSIF